RRERNRQDAGLLRLGYRAAGGARLSRRLQPLQRRRAGGPAHPHGRPRSVARDGRRCHATEITPVATSDPADFLGRCHPAIRAIYAYWEGKRGGRRLPARSDIDPTEFVPHLPGIMLVDVVADERRYVYRLVGTREVEARGQNPTGRPVGEKFHGSSRENVLRNYDHVCRERAALFD